MNRIAIITARGGSKRIPKKNIKEFCGKPIIVYAIEAAIESGVFDEVMVSTDSTEIADIAKAYGAKIPFMRSEYTAGDYATTADVIMEVLDQYHKMGKNFDTAVCIYPTAPFVTAEKLKQATSNLEKSSDYEVIPVVPFSYPPQRGYIMEDDNIKLKYPEYMDSRSQDLEKIYHDAGQFYCLNVQKFIEHNGKIKDYIQPLIVSELEVQDIDTIEDWKIAEIKYRIMKGI